MKILITEAAGLPDGIILKSLKFPIELGWEKS